MTGATQHETDAAGRAPAAHPPIAHPMPHAKRAIDLAVAGSLALACSPLMAGVAAAIRAKMGSPVLFKQARPGYRGKLFVPYKFRTMSETRDRHGKLLPDRERVEAFGALLRRLSIDELPQVFNVLKGEMSIVGPRPLLEEYLDRYPPEFRRRHDVKPGITGWAQVNGRDELTFGQRLALDVWYVDHQSIPLDLRIMGLTVLKVIGMSGNRAWQDEDEILAIDDVNLTDLARARRGVDDAGPARGDSIR
jgi:sugar transferase EpsL